MTIKLSPFYALSHFYFEDLDSLIKARYLDITCDNICGFYYDLFHLSKNYRGNSKEISGLSEFIIFRIIIHLTQCYHKIEISSKRDPNFYFKNDHLSLYQATKELKPKENSKTKNRTPDITILYNDRVYSAIEIKTHPPGNFNYEKHLMDYEILRVNNNNYKYLFIIFNGDGISEFNRNLLENYSSRTEWFSYIILNNPKFKETVFVNHLLQCIPEEYVFI